MPYFTDQAGRSIDLISPPKKIISLVPSQTELLFDLGLDESVIGITKFCKYPDHWFRSKQRVGGTKNPNLQLIHQIEPDLIIGNKEENRKEDIESLSEHFPVWVSDIDNLDDALQMIESLSQITSTSGKAQKIISDITDSFTLLKQSAQSHDHWRAFRVCYLIWQEPFMVVANDTFIDSMIRKCGLENVFAGESRYPQKTIEEIAAAGCDFILVSTEPFPFQDSHVTAMKAMLPKTQVMLVDGELFSWYGSRLVKSARYFQTLINKLHDAAAAR